MNNIIWTKEDWERELKPFPPKAQNENDPADNDERTIDKAGEDAD